MVDCGKFEWGDGYVCDLMKPCKQHGFQYIEIHANPNLNITLAVMERFGITNELKN